MLIGILTGMVLGAAAAEALRARGKRPPHVPVVRERVEAPAPPERSAAELRLERELAEATERAAAHERCLGFHVDCTHELRAPINGILGLADALVGGEEALPPRVVQALHAMVASGKRLDRMVSELLVEDAGSERTVSVNPEPLDLHGAVSEALVVLAPLVGDKSLQLVNDISMHFPLARADEMRVAQVLTHLIGNAIKFTEVGEVRVSAERSAGMLRVSVSDTGSGIAAEAQATLFDPEARDPAVRGFGLPFVRTLVELHHGAVALASELGRGSTVSFTLPEAGPGAQRRGHVHVRTLSARSYKSSIPVLNRALSRVLASANAAPVRIDAKPSSLYSLKQAAIPKLADLEEPSLPPFPAREAIARPFEDVAPPSSRSFGRGSAARPSLWPVSARPRLLVIESREARFEALQRDLADLACELVSASDGVGGLDRFRTDGPFDGVIVDAGVRGVDATSLCRSIREREGAHTLPIVMFADPEHEGTMAAAYAAGVNDFVLVPYAATEVVERVRVQLAVARLARAMHRVVPMEFVALLGHEGLDQLKLGDCVERDLCVMFADFQGFTKASERMTSRQVFAWLNERFGAIVPTIRANGGFVDKFIGDAIMSLFPRGPEGAMRAAIEAAHALRMIDSSARIGIGVHQGPTMIGTLGERHRFAPTVVSDTVNVAARLESLTRRFGSAAIVSEETIELVEVEKRPATRFLGAFRVKGRDKALRMHELLDAESAEVAAEKRAAALNLDRVIAFTLRNDLENAARAAALGLEAHPEDAALHFYAGELARAGRGEFAYDGVIDLKEK